MSYKALFLGSIGSVVETSELQRRAYNLTFREFDLDWVWEPQSYYRMVQTPGGRDRVRDYATAAGTRVDVDAIHACKKDYFEALVLRRGVTLRPGLETVLKTARAQGLFLAFCTTTDRAQVDLILGAAGDALSAKDFDWIGDRDAVRAEKPAPDVYQRALAALKLQPQDVLAIEDTPESAHAALEAGLDVVAFPGRAARDRAFPGDVLKTVSKLDASLLLRTDRDNPIAAE